jgi:hypothetical protein
MALIVNLSITGLLLALVTSATFIATRRLPFDYSPDQPRDVEEGFQDLRAGRVMPTAVIADGDEKS